MQRGEIWWVDLREPTGSEPGYPRPILIIQSDAILVLVGFLIEACGRAGLNLGGFRNGDQLVLARGLGEGIDALSKGGPTGRAVPADRYHMHRQSHPRRHLLGRDSKPQGSYPSFHIVRPHHGHLADPADKHRRHRHRRPTDPDWGD